MTATNVCLKAEGGMEEGRSITRSMFTLTRSSAWPLLPQQMTSSLFQLVKPAVIFWSHLVQVWLPLRAHEFRPQSEFTAACHKNSPKADLCAQVFIQKKITQKNKGSTWRGSWSHFILMKGRKWDCLVCFFSGIVWPQVFASSPRRLKEAFLENNTHWEDWVM